MCEYRKKASAVAKAGDANSVIATEKVESPVMQRILYELVELKRAKSLAAEGGRRALRAAQIPKY